MILKVLLFLERCTTAFAWIGAIPTVLPDMKSDRILLPSSIPLGCLAVRAVVPVQVFTLVSQESRSCAILINIQSSSPFFVFMDVYIMLLQSEFVWKFGLTVPPKTSVALIVWVVFWF